MKDVQHSTDRRLRVCESTTKNFDRMQQAFIDFQALMANELKQRAVTTDINATIQAIKSKLEETALYADYKDLYEKVVPQMAVYEE